MLVLLFTVIYFLAFHIVISFGYLPTAGASPRPTLYMWQILFAGFVNCYGNCNGCADHGKKNKSKI